MFLMGNGHTGLANVSLGRYCFGIPLGMPKILYSPLTNAISHLYLRYQTLSGVTRPQGVLLWRIG